MFFLLRYAFALPDVWLGLIALNAATFLLYGCDKAIAGSGSSRVPERLLELTAFLGSPVGALAAMRVFHHKTRKRSFQLALAGVLLLETSIVWWFFFRK